jgi:hypothetical protein
VQGKGIRETNDKIQYITVFHPKYRFSTAEDGPVKEVGMVGGKYKNPKNAIMISRPIGDYAPYGGGY